jgi:hypothetical protein
VFEAFPEAILEIHTGMMASAILSDQIPCSRLTVQETATDSSSLGDSETSTDESNSAIAAQV